MAAEEKGQRGKGGKRQRGKGAKGKGQRGHVSKDGIGNGKLLCTSAGSANHILRSNSDILTPKRNNNSFLLAYSIVAKPKQRFIDAIPKSGTTVFIKKTLTR